MTSIHLNEIPMETDQLANWIQAKVISPELGELVAELHVVNRMASPIDVPQKEIEEEKKQLIVEGGLSILDRDELTFLLKNPIELLALQEAILVTPSEFWCLKTAEVSVAIQAANWRKVKSSISDRTTTNSAAGVYDTRVSDASQLRTANTNRPRNWVSISATVALVGLVGFVVFWISRFGLTNDDWGWNDHKIYAQDVDESSYLNLLANAANDWFQVSRNGESLSQLIGSCDALISEKHYQLSPPNRDWLVDKCRAWRDCLGLSRELLNEGKSDDRVFAEVDEIVSKLVAALKRKADEIALKKQEF